MNLAANHVVHQVVRALDSAGIAYMLVGSYSSNAYGVPRSTKDADFVIQTDQDVVVALTQRLASEFEVERQMSFETVTGTMRHIIQHRSTSFKVELFFLSSDAHDQVRFTRRRQVELEGVTVSIASPEDVVVTKLRWARGASRAKDAEDVRAVLAVQGTSIDLSYVRSWCRQHGTLDLFEKLRAEAGVID